MGPVLYMASHQGRSSGCSASARVRARASSTTPYPTETYLGLSPLDDQHVAGLIMALEQSIVMGIALAYLFVRMLSEADREDERAERYEAASPS